MPSIRIQMQAPAGTTRVALYGVKFGRASCYSWDIPQCQFVKFTDSELVIRNTADDGNGPAGGQFGLDVELLFDPLSSGSIVGQTTGICSLAVQFDGVWKSLHANQPETVLFQWTGLLKNLSADGAGCK